MTTKILLVGASGQLGGELVVRIKGKAFNESHVQLLTPSSIELDITNSHSVDEYFERYSPLLVINAAAYTNVDRAEAEKSKAFAVNAEGPRNLAVNVARHGGRLVHISTDYVFSGDQTTSYSELDLPQPCNVYGWSKLEGERLVLKELPEALVVRTSWIYSTSGRNFLTSILERAIAGEQCRVVEDQFGAPCAVGGLSNVLIRMLEKLDREELEPGLYHYQCRPVTSWFGFATALLEEARSQGLLTEPPVLMGIPSKDFSSMAQRPRRSVLNTTKLRRALDLGEIDWREELKEVIRSLSTA